MKKYTSDEALSRLEKLSGWALKDNAIEKQFVFKNFKEAMSFMVSVGDAAEERNHHPEFNNVYNKVRLWLSTHDAGGLTDKDFDLAEAIAICADKISFTTGKSI
jgi:4a-hydroxytetrahydrobiopterin dehydratase